MTTMDRLKQWIDWWRGSGELDANGGPSRPRDFTAHHDQELGRAARIVATVQRERGR